MAPPPAEREQLAVRGERQAADVAVRRDQDPKRSVLGEVEQGHPRLRPVLRVRRRSGLDLLVGAGIQFPGSSE